MDSTFSVSVVSAQFDRTAVVDVPKSGSLSSLCRAVEAEFKIAKDTYTLVKEDRELVDMDASLESLCVCEGTEVTLMPVDATWDNLVRDMLERSSRTRHFKDKAGRTPLMLAITMKDPTLVALVAEKEQNFNAVDKEGKSALVLAVQYKLPLETLRLLLDKGAKCEYAYSLRGFSVLSYALKMKNKEAAHLLIERGAKPVGLPLVLSHGWVDTALLMVNHGADASSVDRFGTPALLMAMKKWGTDGAHKQGR
eukprot:TRINITY_DN4137_c0_g1_i1.p1 TRINITY_DN4137_c0_g1~~TRINITY_DN4137_c0_g1_i1.p1  ORF type:complete len:252 (+),score=57.90 TRINITY_DN4137_c0_g1_i1:38-793(+)